MKRFACALVIAFGLAACGNPPVATTPAPPNSAQTTVAQLTKTVADADLAGVKTVITLRDAGKLSQGNTSTIETWLAFVATTDKQIGVILAKPEPWTDQKREILVLLGTVTAPALAGAVDPGAQAVVAQIMTLIAQIRTQVAP